MNIDQKIENLVDFIFSRFGIFEDFPRKERLLIHDNVYGTLRFTEFERKIINSPFLQRLTQIHQMGLAYYVYPGAVHNRFTHSLGVSYISDRIYKYLVQSNKNEEEYNTLRLAGLLHDIGHGPFSHVSDKIFKIITNFPEIPNLKLDSQLFDIPDKIGFYKNIHEVISYHIITSKIFQDLLKDIYSGININLELVPLCITGNVMPYSDENGNHYKTLNKDETLLIKIINGFSDADKIDYIFRDSQFTGIPLPIDVDRLLPFFTVIKPHGSYELGVYKKGARAFHLLLQSKSKMFPTVYHHHTTLACETLLQFGIIDAIKNIKNYIRELDVDKWPPIESAIDLLYYTDNSLLDYLRIINNPISNDVINRLYTRRHYRKIIQLFVWDLRKRLIKSRSKFLEKIRDSDEFTKLQQLFRGKKIAKYSYKLDLIYKRYEKEKEKRIDEFFKQLEDYDKLLEFKQKIISNVNWQEILNKLPENIRILEKDILIDYIINVQISPKFETKPYLQPYILRKDPFSGIDELLTLKDMGFTEPKEFEFQQIIFYVLPEFKNLLKPCIINHIKDFFGKEYFK